MAAFDGAVPVAEPVNRLNCYDAGAAKQDPLSHGGERVRVRGRRLESDGVPAGNQRLSRV
jgi:hypothetical protein